MANLASNSATDTETPKYSYDVNNFETHLIDPDKKDAVWGYKIFIANKINLRCAFAPSGSIGAYNIDFELIKQYANGNQPVELYKVQFDPQDKQAIYTGLNWTIAPIIPTLRSRVLKEMDSVPSEVSCQAVDEMANNQRNQDKLRLKIQPILDAKLAELSKRIGYDQPIKSNISKNILKTPEAAQQMQQAVMDDDEIAIYMDRESGYYNQDVEIANELAIQSVFEWNDFDELRRKLEEDTFDIGICTFRTFINAHNGMPTFQYLRPDKVYVQQSIFRDYHDQQMWYYPVPSSLADILNYFGDELTEKDVLEIWEKSAKRRPAAWGTGYPLGFGWDWRRWNLQDLRKVEIDMFYFEVKTENKIVYEVSKTRNGKDKVKKRKFDYQQPQESQYDKKKQNYYAEVWYKGYVISNIEKAYDWELLNDMYRSKEDPQHCNSTLNIYRSAEKGWTEGMIPSANMYQLNFLKLQHAVLKSKPDGYFWNWDAINQPFIGTAGVVTGDTIIQKFEQTGSAPYHSLDEMGEPLLANANAPHMKAINGPSAETRQYAEYMAFAQNQMAECIGMSPTADAVNPNPRTLVGVQQAASAASASARYTLIKGVEKMVENTATYVSYCIQEIAKHNSSTWEKIKRMVGSMNAAIIESMDNLPLHEFAIYPRAVPTQEEKNLVNQLVLQAYSQAQPQIDLPDVFNVLFLNNYKLAMRLFELKKKKKEAQMVQMQMQGLQMQQQQQQQEMQLKLAIEKLSGENMKANSEVVGKYNLMDTQLKEQGDLLRKFMAEMNKLNIAQGKMSKEDLKDFSDKEHEKTIMDKEHNQNKELISEQKVADIEIEKSKPKPNPKAAA